MNTQKIRNILALYKQHFAKIHKGEIYKWEAVKCFQDNWNLEAIDFPDMLDRSLQKTSNLLGSGQYFPRRMIKKNAVAAPEKVRQLYNDLFNEEIDILDRITNFKEQIKALNKINYPGKNDYQDHRAISVYLALRYPDRYYLYKSRLFKDFAPMVDYPYELSRGAIKNISHYYNLCNLLCKEIVSDDGLLKLHQTRLTEKDYKDTAYHILTQDVIYAAVNYLGRFTTEEVQLPAIKRLSLVEKQVHQKIDEVQLKGVITNHIENQRENKHIGDLGEILVLQYEKERLEATGSKKIPLHISKEKGDGLGYDILSYDDNGSEIYIEVKTTRGNLDSPFFITKNELLKSQIDKDRFILYRLYNYDVNSNTAKHIRLHGDLSSWCTDPVIYKTVLASQ